MNVGIFRPNENVLECLRTDNNILAFKSNFHVYLCSVQSLVMQPHPHPHKNHPNKKKKNHHNKPQMKITVTV